MTDLEKLLNGLTKNDVRIDFAIPVKGLQKEEKEELVEVVVEEKEVLKEEPQISSNKVLLTETMSTTIQPKRKK